MGHKIFRSLSLSIGVCGFVLYVPNLITWWGVGQQMGSFKKPLLEQTWFVLDSVVFLSGLPPLLLAIYFLILKRSARANLCGLIYGALFIPIHYYVAAITAHTTLEIYLPTQLVELTVAIVLIAFWKGKDEQVVPTPVGEAHAGSVK